MKADRAIVIFGATGDLSLRMLLPSLYFLELDGLLPAGWAVLGASRSALSDEAFAEKTLAAVKARADGHFDEGAWKRFRARLSYVAVDAETPASFEGLKAALSGAREAIYYLSTSPNLFEPICANLQAAGLAHDNSRIVVEKPMGHDLASCREINDVLGTAFDESRIFRIDHYLGKEAVQNLIALRFANAFFEPLWDHVSIEQVQITVAETVGVEGRWSYYDDYGAIRDMVQNHILQLLCLVAMEPPAHLDADSVRNEKVKVLRSLRPLSGRDVWNKTARGQYGKGVADGRTAIGYADETGGGESDTETFVAIRADIDNWRWAGVPFYLRTGKRLPERSSEIMIQFRAVPHSIFSGQDLRANRLTIRLQPEEEISLSLMNKTPSIEGVELKPVSLNLSLDDAFKQGRRRIAYERLLLEAIKNNTTLFVRRDEQEAAWIWVDGIVDGWKRQGMAPSAYPAGAWGPSAAYALIERDGHSWDDR
ncbi:glucose-6-phosphate dehydrogenase [Caulobacter sp. CCUG 60055]|uniref:glucose-6-phosphate dehydrogenase n=1 Tax=Caulobacter sp. CCUG 60055 TaxID=2100090 RepID=UPI001FA72FB4|nr:glucose-6-phosphate dehydrogenase [Caulobacter sp. CCUG 60055]MBQ1543737.1 glucose-6-phosphate dehydrogenase [Caulobacteraceae bacterium]MCI3180800.1 glucose-6-phosphate dehydrogenase [Caulobacter sp. CCUG 60055]